MRSIHASQKWSLSWKNNFFVLIYQNIGCKLLPKEEKGWKSETWSLLEKRRLPGILNHCELWKKNFHVCVICFPRNFSNRRVWKEVCWKQSLQVRNLQEFLEKGKFTTCLWFVKSCMYISADICRIDENHWKKTWIQMACIWFMRETTNISQCANSIKVPRN